MKKVLLLSWAFFLIFSTGKTQNMGVFNGTSYAKVTTAASPPYVTTFTLSTWVKFSSLTGTFSIASWNCANGQIFIRTEGTNMYYRMWNGAAVAVKNKTALAINTWYHIAVVVNAGVATIYINGIDDTDSTPAAGVNNYPSLGTTTSFAIGTTASNNSASLQGDVDDFNYWTVAKSGLEISTIMNGSLTGTESNLKLLLDFENNLTDKSASAYLVSNTGTITYSPTTRNTSQTQTQSITFGPLSALVFNGSPDVALSATSNSGLTVGYTSSNTSVATIVNGKIHAVGAGTTDITAYQSGNQTYLAANPIVQPLQITPVPGNYDLSFSGTSYLTPTTQAAPFGSTFSISGWFKPTTGSTREIATWSTSTNGTVGHFLRLEGDNYLYYGQWNGSFKKIKCNIQINNGLWSHIAMVKNNNVVKFYINGVEDFGTYVSGTAPMNNNTAGDNFRIGIQTFNNTNVDGWMGEMDDLTFNTTARSAASIQTEYTTGINKSEAGMWGVWTFNDMINPTKDSSTVAANDLNITGAKYLISDINAVPTISALSNGFVKNTTARAYITAPNGAILYWALFPLGTSITDPALVLAGTGSLQHGNLVYQTPGILDYFSLKGLLPSTGYTLYAVLQGSKNLSTISSTTFTTTNTTTDLTSQISGVRNLLSRLLPERYTEFDFAQIPAVDDTRDVFELSSSGGKILVKGSSGTAMTSGINYYLHTYCNASFSWNGDQTSLPTTLPIITGTVRKETPYQYRYSLNYCTYNYTMSFWDWNRWEREIDLMAMQGVNLLLAPIGNEAVWQNTLSHFGYSFADVQDFVVGPAYTAWWLMDNLQGMGGKVSQAYIDGRVVLQRQILARLKELGMRPVLQGYAGMVPFSFGTKVPAAAPTVYAQGGWAAGTGRPPVITGAYCDSVAKYWYQESVKLYGVADFYGGDIFHEGGAPPAGLDLGTYASKLQSWMLNANPLSSWVLQAWQGNPKSTTLSGIKKDQALILDYGNDVYGQWKSRSGFNGYPWVYGVINNFGGRMGIYARLQKVADDVYTMQHSAIRGNNIGIGIAPEAIIYNQVSYDLIWDLAWDTTHLNTANWVKKFADRRYGQGLDNTQNTWTTLNNNALACAASQEGGTGAVFNARPSLTISGISYTTTNLYYPAKDVVPAWTNMMNSIDVLKDKTTFKHDLVDISRQCLVNYGKQVYTEMVAAFNASNQALFATKSALFLDMMLDQDSLLRTREEYLLGKWINDARTMGTSPTEANLFELNARCLPTTWSPTDGSLTEYANHEWAGLTKDYYRERWKLFISDLSGQLKGNAAVNTNFYAAFERPWTQRTGNGYDVTANGKEIEMSTYIYKKYMPLMGYALTNNSPVVAEQDLTTLEKQGAGATVGTVIATDPDPGQTLSYQIYSQSLNGAFSIDAATGTLKVADASAMNAAVNPTFSLTVKVSDNGTPAYSVYRKVNITLTTVNGINGNSSANKATCFPNPAKNRITIKSPSGFKSNIEVVNAAGNIVLEKKIVHTLESETTLQISTLAVGSYIICFKAKNNELIRLKFSK